jgi:uncharacterized membrane protein SpoIIM required for sporulation
LYSLNIFSPDIDKSLLANINVHSLRIYSATFLLFCTISDDIWYSILAISFSGFLLGLPGLLILFSFIEKVIS